jgi:hypothetical protein
MTSKRELLEAYLGNFDEYIFTGWMFDNAETDMANAANWECHWKTPIYPLTDFKLDQLPEIILACHCTTPIIWNCLIKHKPSGRLEFVGSVCMHYFEMNLKRCVQCNIPNRCATRRCSTCRRRCKLHGEYHDDNTVHTQPPPQPRVVRTQPRVVPTRPLPGHLLEEYVESDPIPQMYLDIQVVSRRPRVVLPQPLRRHLPEEYMDLVLEPRTPRRSIDAGYNHCDTLERDDQVHADLLTEPAARSVPFPERPLTFGKSRGKRPENLVYEGSDGWSYYFWLFGCDLLTETDKTDLSVSLRYMRPPKGKYNGTLSNFENIKENDPGYYSWLKRTWNDAFVKYLP